MRINRWLIILFAGTSLALLIYTLPAITAGLVLIKGAGRPVPAVVQEIVDAQTLLLRVPDGKRLCLVLNGINTPLKHQPGYRRSVLGLIDLSQGRLRGEVVVQLDAVISENVWLGTVYDLREDINGNLELIRSGYAWPDEYQHDEKDPVKSWRQDAADALQQAQNNTLGHWQGIHIGEAPEAPAQSYIKTLIRDGHSAAACQPREQSLENP